VESAYFVVARAGKSVCALASYSLSAAGVLGPEAFDAVPFLDPLAGKYGSPWGMTEMAPAT